MLQAHLQNRRQSQAAARRLPSRPGACRRLGIEALEGRMMLSTTVLEFTPPNLTPLQITLSDQPSVTGDLVSVASQDGGFIQNFFTRAGADLDGTAIHVGTLSGASSLDMRLFQASDTDSYGTHVASFQSGVLWSDGIRPISFERITGFASVGAPTSSLSDFVFVFQPSSLAVAEKSEGGSIPIEPILAGVGSGRIDNLKTPLVGTVNARGHEAASHHGPPGEPLSAARNDLSAEWARPILGEIAGGEPVREPSAQKVPSEWEGKAGSEKPPVGSGPLSNGLRTFPDADGHAKSGMASFAWAMRHRSESLERHPARVEMDFDFPSAGLTSQAFPDGEAAPAAAGAAAEIPEAALAAAFDELAARKAANLRESHDESRSRKSLIAAPLLLMLAIERIATANSRRATSPSAIPTWRPLRSHREPPERR